MSQVFHRYLAYLPILMHLSIPQNLVLLHCQESPVFQQVPSILNLQASLILQGNQVSQLIQVSLDYQVSQVHHQFLMIL